MKGGDHIKRLTQTMIEEILNEYSSNYEKLGGNPAIKEHKMSEARTFCQLFQMIQEKVCEY